MKNKKKRNVIEHLKESRGIISYACQKAGISRQTFYMWMKSDQEFKDEVENINEENIDIVESKLLNKINEGDIAAILFYLKTKGKSRGYVERQELTAKDGGDLVPHIDIEIVDKTSANDGDETNED